MCKNSLLRQDLPISINDRVICHFARVLFSRNFAYAKFRENKVLAKISEFTVHVTSGYFELQNVKSCHFTI